MMQKKTVLLRSFENTSYAPVNRVDCGFRHSIHPPPTFAVLPQPPRTPAKNITIFRTENLTFPPTMTDTRERGADRQNRNRTEKQRRRERNVAIQPAIAPTALLLSPPPLQLFQSACLPLREQGSQTL